MTRFNETAMALATKSMSGRKIRSIDALVTIKDALEKRYMPMVWPYNNLDTEETTYYFDVDYDRFSKKFKGLGLVVQDPSPWEDGGYIDTLICYMDAETADRILSA